MSLSKIIRSENIKNVTEWHMPEVQDNRPQNKTSYHEGIGALGGKIPTAKDLEALQKQAYEESYKEGYQDGLNIAKDEQSHIFQALSVLFKELNHLKDELNNEVKKELAQLSIIIAKQIIHREVITNPDYIHCVVDECIMILPAFSKNIVAHLNPDDACVIMQMLKNSGHTEAWNVVEDASITRGGCKIISEQSILDNTVEMQVSKIAAKFLDHSNDQQEINV